MDNVAVLLFFIFTDKLNLPIAPKKLASENGGADTEHMIKEHVMAK